MQIGEHGSILKIEASQFYPDSVANFSHPTKNAVQGVTKITKAYKVLDYAKWRNLTTHWELTPWVTKTQYRGIIYEMQDYYFFNNIYFYPPSLVFGKITNEVKVTGEIWNAYNRKNNVVITNDITKDYAFKLNGSNTFRPMELQDYTLLAFKRGNLNFNTNIEFVFDTGLEFLPVSGFRVSAIAYPPNREFTETFKYKTSISSSINDTEQRASLSKYPTREFDYTFKIEAKYVNTLLEMFQDAQSGQFLSPLWHELTFSKYKILKNTNEVTVKVGFETKIGESVFIYKDEFNYELLEVVDIVIKDNDMTLIFKTIIEKDYNRALVIPAIPCSIKQPIQFKTIDTVNMVEMRAILTQDQVEYLNVNGEIKYDLFEGIPVVDNFNETDEWVQRQNVYFYDKQPAPSDFLVISDKGHWNKNFKTECNSKEDYYKWVNFFNWCKGRWKSFWLKDEHQSFTLLKDYIVNTSELEVASYGQVVSGQVIRIAKSKNDKKNVFYTRVEYAGYTDDILKITLADTVPFPVMRGKATINLLRKFRLASDDVKIKHQEYNHKMIEFMAQGLINDW